MSRFVFTYHNPAVAVLTQPRPHESIVNFIASQLDNLMVLLRELCILRRTGAHQTEPLP